MRNRIDVRVLFIALWAGISLLKVAMASRLPLFVDEAFYWQESRHLSWAYSDLPGLTAWLIRLGDFMFGEGRLALRAPFLLIAAALPWLVVRISAREFDMRHAWLAGIAALLLPLAGSLGLLALPDVPMALATLLCIDAGARLLRNVDEGAALTLGIGLAIGALSHYRFIAVIGVGFVVLLSLPAGRRALLDPRVWIAIAFGAAAWTPLMAWNMDNAEAGLRFQLVDRHPWAFHADGALFLLIQGLLVTPLLFVALMSAAVRRGWAGDSQRYLAWLGGLVVLGFFVLGFFADTRRVSFHWPLPGYLALLPLLPVVLARWTPWLRCVTWAVAACGLVAVLGYYAAVSVPSLRAQSAALKWYPSNFAGWGTLASAVQDVRAGMPRDTRIVADNFKVGAELGFMLDDPDMAVLEHPLNREHGRAPQLKLWGLEARHRKDIGDGPLLLVASSSDVKFSQLLGHYQDLCRRMGPLPAPRVVNIDHGGKRFLLFALPAKAEDGTNECVTPAIAHINDPKPGVRVPAKFKVRGWAMKDAVGIERVVVTLDGTPIAEADYGREDEWPLQFYRGRSKDPNGAAIAFDAVVDATDAGPGRHWLGLEVVSRDGRREAFPEQPVMVMKPK